jgi:hypothetical protein
MKQKDEHPLSCRHIPSISGIAEIGRKNYVI